MAQVWHGVLHDMSDCLTVQTDTAYTREGADTKFKAMDKKIRNKLNMYKAVQATCKQYQTAWNGIPKFEEVMSRFNTQLSEMETLMANYSKDKRWITAEKNAVYHELMNRTYALSVIARAYAIEQKDSEMIRKFTVKKTSLRKGDVKLRLDRIDNIINMVNEVGYDLIDFGVSPELLEEVTALRDKFNGLIWSPRMVRVKRTQTRLAVTHMVKSIDLLISVKLSGMISILATEHPAFSTQFNSARVIVDLRSKRSPKPSSTPFLPGVDETESPPIP